MTPHIPSLVKCMSNPDNVPACIKSLSSQTFVAEVTAPALAVLVPLLLRALNDRSMEVQRRTVVVVDNLVKLVRDQNVAAIYLSPLVEGVDKIAKGAAFPEVSLYCIGVLIRTDRRRCEPLRKPLWRPSSSPVPRRMVLHLRIATLTRRLRPPLRRFSHSFPPTW